MYINSKVVFELSSHIKVLKVVIISTFDFSELLYEHLEFVPLLVVLLLLLQTHVTTVVELHTQFQICHSTSKSSCIARKSSIPPPP